MINYIHALAELALEIHLGVIEMPQKFQQQDSIYCL